MYVETFYCRHTAQHQLQWSHIFHFLPLILQKFSAINNTYTKGKNEIHLTIVVWFCSFNFVKEGISFKTEILFLNERLFVFLDFSRDAWSFPYLEHNYIVLEWRTLCTSHCPVMNKEHRMTDLPMKTRLFGDLGR